MVAGVGLSVGVMNVPELAGANVGAVADLMHTHFYFLAIFVIL